MDNTTNRTMPLLLTLVSLLLAACSPKWEIAEAPYEGPPLGLAQREGNHAVVLQAPSAGWNLRIDRERRQDDLHEIFVTVRRPDPAFFHAQVETQQIALSNVQSSNPASLVARVLPATAEAKGAYRRADDAGPGDAPPPELEARPIPLERPGGGSLD
ncbi:MAG: hypothetical protein AAFR38_00240 [Planctomycetota bacterium]